MLFVAKAAAVFAAIAAIAFTRRRAFHPFSRFGPANWTTTVRAMLVSMAAAAIGEPDARLAAIVAIAVASAATLLDGVDGFLARRTQMTSAFGARFDMEIDALLILVLAILAWRLGKAGAWVLASGLLRYVFVAAAWGLPWLGRPLASSLRGKTVCVVQIAALIVVLLPAVVPPASAIICAAALALLAHSFLIDTIWLWRHR